MRDILVLLIIFGSIPFCIARPYVGVLLWAWISYMNPHKLTWGVAYDFPVAMIIGSATLVGTLFLFVRKSVKLPMERETVILILLWIIFTMSTIGAIYPEISWFYWERTSKILLFTFLTLMLVTNMQRLKTLLYVIVFSVGIYGFKGGIFSILKSFQYRVWGPADSFLYDANDIALGLNMLLPLMYFMAKEETNNKLRYALWGTFWLSIPAIIGTYSRGGFITLCVVLFLILVKTDKKILATFVFAIGIIGVLTLIPAKYKDRISSIQGYEEDGSAQERINAWYFAWNLSLDRPLLGGGFEPMTSETYQIYAPKFKTRPTSAHSIYFQMLGDHGFIALFLFLGLLGLSVLSCRRLQREFRSMNSSTIIVSYAKMLEISLYAYSIGGLFYNRAYHDLMFHMISIVILLKVFAYGEKRSKQTEKLNLDLNSTMHSNPPMISR